MDWEFIRLSHKAWACMWWACMRMHENRCECMRMTHIQGGACGSFTAELHYTTCLIMNGNAWEWLRMTENHSYSWRGEGHSRLIYIIRHAWEWIGKAPDYLIMHEHVCDENACECMRMTENVWEWLMFRVGHSMLVYIIRHGWECMRMHLTIP